MKIAKVVRELITFQCSWEDFCHMLSNELSKWLKFHSQTNTNETVFADLFPMLLTMKMRIIEQTQSQLGYLGRNNDISTDRDKRQAGEYCQAFKSCLEFHPIYNRRFYQLALNLILSWQCNVYSKIETNHTMQTACLDVPESQI